MKKVFPQLVLIFFCAGIMMSGMQTITGYYTDPDGYGFHNLEAAFFQVSIAVTLLGVIIMSSALGRLERFCW
jgi:hypothetical protein